MEIYSSRPRSEKMIHTANRIVVNAKDISMGIQRTPLDISHNNWGVLWQQLRSANRDSKSTELGTQ
jgi:hypothetical protein